MGARSSPGPSVLCQHTHPLSQHPLQFHAQSHPGLASRCTPAVKLQPSPEPLTFPHSDVDRMSIVSPAGSPNARAGRRGAHSSPSGPSPLLLNAGFPRSPPSRVHRHRGAHTRTPAGTKLRPAARRRPLAHLAGAPPAYGARTRSLCPSPLDPALPSLGAFRSWVPAAPTAQQRETGLGLGYRGTNRRTP